MASSQFPPPIAGLGDIAAGYRGLLCDVWGVLHNGVAPFLAGAEALARFRTSGTAPRPVVLITNAPRPAWSVVRQLADIGVPGTAFDEIVTSGDVTRQVMVVEGARHVFHLGPARDLPLYDGLPLLLTGEADAGMVCCTGLVDDDVETAYDYAPLLSRFAARGLTMVCANPDLVVDRGGRLIPCAGALAVRYQALGGTAIMVGKPYPAVYAAAMERFTGLLGRTPEQSEILAIGDGVATDIAGANRAGLDALLITAGIHALEYGTTDAADPARVADFLGARGAHAEAVMHRLAW